MLSLMGYDITVTVEMHSSPKAHVIDVLDGQFEAVQHDTGSKVVTITEHVAMSDEADAIEFVRALVGDAIPEGSKITDVTVAAD